MSAAILGRLAQAVSERELSEPQSETSVVSVPILISRFLP